MSEIKPLYTTVKNPIVRLWLDKNEKIYKIEIRGDNYVGYHNP